MKLSRVVTLSIWLFTVIAASPCWCWGPTAHTMVVQYAIQLLPPEMKPYYDANARYVEALVTLPDDWRQTHKGIQDAYHFIDLDLLDKPPFTKLMENREELGKKMDSEETAKTGLLPWAIRMRFDKLAKAFKAGDMEDVDVQSALLGHYVGDAHVPFHNTQYYDGKTPEQKGIHFRWEAAITELMLKPASIKTNSAENVDDVLKSALNWSIESYKLVDAILAAEDRAREQDSVRGFKYYKSLFDQTEPVMVSQISHAAERLAGLWIAAWKQAGKPKLEAKAAALYWGR